jgi:DNA mismatch repair protein MutS
MTRLTPMQRQYYEIKKANPDCLLLFRLGDFYEMFDNDAVTASKILGITLTARNKGKENEMKMCGIPHHSSENYINRLIKNGKKIAICEQTSDPNLPGIVKREVVQIITPGTVLSDQILDQKKANYLASIKQGINNFALSFLDISTGEFKTCLAESFEDLLNELKKISPQEILISKDQETNFFELRKFFTNFSFWYQTKTPIDFLKNFFKVESLKMFDLENERTLIENCALLLDYVIDTQKGSIKQIKNIKKYSLKDTMCLDIDTFKNLEIFQTLYGNQEKGSLLSVIDKTVTSMGGRKLREFMINPLKNKEDIEKRLNEVEKGILKTEEVFALRKELEQVRDIERLLSKIVNLKANPKDLLALRESLEKSPKILNLWQKIQEKNDQSE